MFKSNHSARQRGIGMIEAVLYIVIAIAVIIGGIIFYLNASQGTRLTDAVRSIVGIQSGVRSLYLANSEFEIGGEDLESAVISSGLVRNNLISPEGKIVNEWQGEVKVRGFNGGFVVDYGDVPLESCVKLAIYNAQGTGTAGNGIGAVTINGVLADTNGDGQVTPEEATAACTAASS